VHNGTSWAVVPQVLFGLLHACTRTPPLLEAIPHNPAMFMHTMLRTFSQCPVPNPNCTRRPWTSQYCR
jgi:hypothetical protein